MSENISSEKIIEGRTPAITGLSSEAAKVSFHKLHALLCAQLEAALSSWDVSVPGREKFLRSTRFLQLFGQYNSLLSWVKKESTGRSIEEIRAKALELGLNDSDIFELTESSGHGPALLVLYEGRWINRE